MNMNKRYAIHEVKNGVKGAYLRHTSIPESMAELFNMQTANSGVGYFEEVVPKVEVVQSVEEVPETSKKKKK